MSDDIVSAAGERAAMGGYVPQFNEFARFAYRELVNNNLEWIKIADPEAEKLDDIQYATRTEVRAYQVKWTIADQTISFLNFTTLLPLILSSWQKLAAIHIKDKKKVIAHLLTNKTLSKHDHIMSGKKDIGTFSDFYTEVWQKWKMGQPVDKKWNVVIKKMMTDLKLSDADFKTFVSQFEFHPEHVGVDLKVGLRLHSADVEDQLAFRDFLLEKVADPARIVPFTRQEIIDGLLWAAKFKTTFNHELSVDINRYQSITSTVEDLNEKLSAHTSGYLFLVGGPGSGKSTLLTEWMKGRTERIFKYYAFDFTNPSFAVNYQDRGDATNLYFDLVFQLKEAGIYRKQVLPYKDLVFLKSVFAEQLEELGREYARDGRRAIIVIDGLDHVPREYKSVRQSFLRDLPLPADLPEGVFILLGSQSYELEDLSQEIKAEWKSSTRSVQMNPMGKKEVIKYADASEIKPPLNAEQQELLFEKSQGHPLYLSYLVEQLKNAQDRDDALSGFITIDGNILLYYNKIWEPISGNAGLIETLGLMSRINESISIAFVKEWGLPKQSLIDFRRDARALFNETQNDWTFFHNSFRLFLLSKTAIDPLTDEFDSVQDIGYHQRLGEFYNKSAVEPGWKQNYHHFASGEFDQFIAATSPEAFFSQLINFRPTDEIRRDIKLGIEIAQKDSNLHTLLRYLFSLAELDRRNFNLEPASYIEELLQLGKISEAKRYARKGAALLINQRYALEVGRLFDEFGESAEGQLLFSLAQPEMVTTDGIIVDYRENIDNSTYSLLQEWVTSAALFQSHEIVLQKIKNFKAINVPTEREPAWKPELISELLQRDLIISLINQQKWPEAQQLLSVFDLTVDKQKNYYFHLLRYAVNATIGHDRDRAREYLKMLLANFSPAECSSGKRIAVADLIITLEKEKELAAAWIDGIAQPLIKNSEELGFEANFDAFRPLIKFNKVLNLIGKGVTITAAVPSGAYPADDHVVGEYQRMLCLITQLLCEGIENKPLTNLARRVQPIIQFYNREVPMGNTYWYRLTQIKTKYIDFLIQAVAASGPENVKELVSALRTDIAKHGKYWTSEHVRSISNTLLEMNLETQQALEILSEQEPVMLIDKDINGRITECMQQAKSYLLNDDNENAEKWLKRGIEESIGVGYRKDYQYNTWLDWLIQNIQKHPQTAAQNVSWFLSHLHHLKEATEGRAADLAASKLLGLTLDWNPAAGLVQMKWMLDNALIDFEDAVGTFIESLLAQQIGQQEYELLVGIYADLYLLFAVGADSSLLRLILQKGETLYKETFDQRWVPVIHQMIMTKALDEQRPSLLIVLEDFLADKGKNVREIIPGFAIPEKPDHRSTRSSSSSQTLVLSPDHRNISHRDVMAEANTYEQFRDFLRQEDKANSWYDWTEVFTKMETTIDLARIREISGIIAGNRKPIELLCLLGEKAHDLGDNALAEQLINESLAQSSASGWMTFYDGGSRIKTFTAMRKIKGAEGTKKAFDVFSYDLLHSESAGNYAEALDEILPVIAPGYDQDAVWSQLFDYLQRLMSTSIPSENLPNLSPENKDLYETIIDFLNYFAAYPVTLVYTAAQRLLAGQLNGKIHYPLEVVNALQSDTDAGAELFTGILLLSQQCGNDLSAFYLNLQELATSSNYMVRTEAAYLLELNDQQIPEIVPKNLSPLYKLDLGDADPGSASLNIEGDLYPLGQIIRLIKPLDTDLKILARITGIAEKTLMYRTYVLMRQSNIPDEWLNGGDGAFSRHLEQIHLRYSYTKERVLAVKRAIARIVSELVDAGELDEDDAIQFFGPRDKVPDLFSATPRSGFIGRLSETKSMLYDRHWLDNIKENPRLKETVLRHQDGRNIIGEYTVQTSLNWGKAQQIFMSQIKGEPAKNKGWLIFGDVVNGQTKNYHDLEDTGNSLIIVREETHGNFSTLSNWIAINPVLARYLGWYPLSGKLFAWADEVGNCLVESVYWMDGNIKMQPPHLYSEAGEGWYVLATDQAMAELREIEPLLYQEKFIYRSKENDSNYEQHSTIIKLD
jgi:hypothetical protein